MLYSTVFCFVATYIQPGSKPTLFGRNCRSLCSRYLSHRNMCNRTSAYLWQLLMVVLPTPPFCFLWLFYFILFFFGGGGHWWGVGAPRQCPRFIKKLWMSHQCHFDESSFSHVPAAHFGVDSMLPGSLQEPLDERPNGQPCMNAMSHQNVMWWRHHIQRTVVSINIR